MDRSVLIVDENLPYLINNIKFATGGASVQSMNWMNGFMKNGIKVNVLSDANVENISKIRIINLFGNRKETNYPNLVNRFFAIFKAIKSCSPDYLYVSIPSWNSFLYGICCKLLNIKYIQRVSNDYMTDNRLVEFSGKVKYYLFYYGIKFTDVILCQNSYQEINLKRKFSNKNVLKLYNPFDIPDSLPEFNCGEYVAWVGIFQYQKNIPALYKIASELPQIKFKIAGINQENIDSESSAYIDKLLKLDNVEFVGLLSREEIFSFLGTALCLLNTSRYEGFSNTFLEAMIVGTPIITCKGTDPDDIISKNNFGVVVDDYNLIPAQIFNMLQIQRPDFRNRGLTYIRANHTPKILAKHLISYLDKEIKNNYIL
jgi:glycosyltransferase involved in cell wall biosynthesis